ncbi:Ankyrin repeat, PH and SEC7 domain containing protein secG [Trichoderma lentiforme]|uniref:Ankyrin repeat, PH and SEC7 domain containing protein secG n=1 Tax=Trichoderma lentiforme TaxID=1567552 RepID=A0A9P4XP70_9HYPO|nr:Ankyrin repeat, PH and SEC7 domain containing protein secG [Trichoderma lentiforme]
MATQTATETKTHNEYTVGWVCALPKEQTAATAMLDQRHGDLPKPANDSNTYTLGSIGNHNIVIACLPKGHIGNSPAATVAAQMVSTFPSVRFGLMVGIGGGVPPKVRLGDVVVSTPVGNFPGVVQWDLGKAKDGNFERTGSLNNPPASLLTALTKLETEHELVGSKIPEYLDQLKQNWPRLAAKYLRSDSLEDICFKADYSHVYQSTTEDHVSSGSSYESEEEESCQYCDKTKIIKRKPRDMRVHYGIIASGNQVIKSATHRDKLNNDLGGHLLCIEMEAAGLMNNFPCIVIRGICDYADSHKNKDWQEYAAAVAAAFAKELLGYAQPSDVGIERTIKEVLGDVLTNVSSTKADVSYIKSNLDNDEDLRILEWVTSIDYGSQQSDFLRRREPGTGQWLIDSREYQDWLGARKQTLFCPGIPGAGKTILTSIVVDHLESTYRADPTIRIAYIYCNYRRQEEQSIEKLLGSLLKQLSQGENCIPNCLKGFYKHHEKKRTQLSLLEIQTALQSAAENYSTVFIVIDALDECQNLDGSRQKFLTELFSLQEKSGCNLFMTSRVIPEIVDRFNGISMSLEIRASTEDIERYLKGNTGQLPAFVQQSQELQQMIAAEISKAVDGMFLLAQIYLNSLNDKMTPKAMKNALKGFHKPISGLDEAEKTGVLAQAYEQAMLRINGQQSGFKELAHKVLLWIVCAERQLTTTELQHALAVEIGELEIDKENLPSIQDMVSVCAGLVTVDYESSIIRLVHYTTQEYFNQTRKLWFPDADVNMTDICVSYLLFEDFENEPTADYFWGRSQPNSLYSYAAQNWGHHARKASKPSHRVMEFLECKTKMNASIQWLMADASHFKDWYWGKQRPTFGMTNLHLGAYFGIEETVKTLLKKPINVNQKDEKGSTPLLLAARNGHEAVVKLLLAMPNINIKLMDGQDNTRLLRAASNGHDAVVKLLLSAGVDPNFGNGYQTPLSKAAEGGHEAVVKLLLAMSNNDIHLPLYGAVVHEHAAVVKLLLAAGADPDLGRSHYTTPLMCAVNNGDVSSAEMLLAAGADPNLRDQSYAAPLSRAASNGDVSITKMLLAAGADPNLSPNIRPGQSGATPLLNAVNQGHDAVVKLLLAAGADPNLRGQSGAAPLLNAAARGHEVVAKLLLAAGADPDLGDKDGETWLHIAASKGRETTVKHLLAAGANPQLENKQGQTPLLHAAMKGHKVVVELLLKAGAHPDVRGNYGITPLSIATRSGYQDVVKLLLAAGADPDLGDKVGSTPLLTAQKRGHEEGVYLPPNKRAKVVDLADRGIMTRPSASIESGRKRRNDEVE